MQKDGKSSVYRLPNWEKSAVLPALSPVGLAFFWFGVYSVFSGWVVVPLAQLD
jgi:hypothetical protein